MTFEDLESWQQARHLTRETMSGLIRSTESRKSRILGFLSPLFALLSPV